MRDNDPPRRDLRRLLCHCTGDVFIRQAVEAVAPHAFLVQRVGDGEAIGHRGMAAMKRGVEACHLHDAGKPLADCAQDGFGRRIVQRREWIEGFDPCQRRRVHHHRRGHIRAAMHHAMAEGHQAGALQRAAVHRRQRIQCRCMVGGIEHRLVQRFAIRRGDAQADFAAAADALHRAALAQTQAAFDAVDAEFQAGGAGIQHAQATLSLAGVPVGSHELLAFHLECRHAPIRP